MYTKNFLRATSIDSMHYIIIMYVGVCCCSSCIETIEFLGDHTSHTTKYKNVLYKMAGFLWRLWKWLLHLVTGRCEIYRLAVWSAPIQQRAWSISKSTHRPLLSMATSLHDNSIRTSRPLTGRSLEVSHIKTLSDVVTARELGVTEALEVIASAKKIPSEQRHQ